jgi:hypothetical protein
MAETQFVSNAVRELRRQAPSFIVLKHADRFTHGVPDVSISGHRSTSWWEFKHADPDFKSPGVQELTMLRLANATQRAWYVIYYEVNRQVFIITPEELKKWPHSPYVRRIEGFNHRDVASNIINLHLEASSNDPVRL